MKYEAVAAPAGLTTSLSREPGPGKRLLRSLASLNLLFTLAAALGLSMIAGTLAPKLNIYHHPAFQALLGLLSLNTVSCVAYRWRAIRKATLISHVGVLLILGGAALTSLKGISGSLPLQEGEPGLSLAVRNEVGATFSLPFQVQLEKFWIDYHSDSAHILHLSHKTEGWHREVRVRPGESIPIEGIGEIRVGKFLADFFIGMDGKGPASRSNETRNPALELSVGAEKKARWVFSRFPGMHAVASPLEIEYEFQAGDIRQFNSRIRVRDLAGADLGTHELNVNSPASFQGWTLYQSSYDPDNPGSSILTVRKDPGVPWVYAGFVILLAGLAWNVMREKV